ncbi:acyl-CoA thioesterase [Paenibacillus sp. GCM10012307]|uniref:Acyl-CoA thioesterase n=1 Tax=Paenibacillus roseus TaxID=2798579 RepID=A0A934IWL8_9BACL|nr:thioesterase family protein [Paenibacillus roseus]MBJ6360647.1 acyl-CoA thioesterase [Paenibacillus roseus]
MTTASLTIVVRSTEIDVNGHVNNARYLEYLEWGREEWYEKAGLYYQVLRDLGVLTVTVNININYRKECLQGEKLTIRTFPEKVGNTSFVLRQEIANASNEICIDARVTCVTVDTETRKSVMVPGRLRELFSGK